MQNSTTTPAAAVPPPRRRVLAVGRIEAGLGHTRSVTCTLHGAACDGDLSRRHHARTDIAAIASVR
ncbi:hypothetical protein [Streptomyces bohaiensis]|uniref:Uncharacterized protein n=1 Tax=Streptomyces bohaiensis TaxID=1431344 RepID=A0ABX1C4R1_9ACTN|nr:hypothetical protein [Streptomyces bohaiensis]NJQ14204.1 hypothetical protein [Streptomyces bohaiensis]